MSATSNFMDNKVVDFYLRGQTLTPPATAYVGLFRATKGFSNSIRSTAVSSGDTVLPATPNGHMYRCSTSGTTGSGEPTWPTSNSGTVTDGTAVWTEMYADFKGNTGNLTEVSGGAYARVSISSSLANWAGTQGAGTTVASTGSSGTTSNNNSITFPGPSGANWGVIFGFGLFDASSAGNLHVFAPLTTPKTVNNNDPAPSFAAGALTWQVDN